MGSSQHKVYIPDTARDNQYILAELLVSEALMQHYTDELSCYQQLSHQFFVLAQQAGLRNVHFIANDKLPVVRFHTEAFTFQTADQILFFYNPQYHEAQQSFFDGFHRARKISLLCLATGTEIRNNSAQFHQQVQQVVKAFKQQLPIADVAMKIRDHQHLSYDLYAREKGCDSSFGYKLRGVAERYVARDCQLPNDHHTMNYVSCSLPVSRRLKEVVGGAADLTVPFTAFYLTLEQNLLQAAQENHLTRIGLVADGSTPIVRNSSSDKARAGRELRMLSFDITSPHLQFFSHWHPDELVDSLHFVLAAGQDDHTEYGYGRFMNQVEGALKQLSKSVALQPEKDDFVVRFHQHISYNI